MNPEQQESLKDFFQQKLGLLHYQALMQFPDLDWSALEVIIRTRDLKEGLTFRQTANPIYSTLKDPEQ